VKRRDLGRGERGGESNIYTNSNPDGNAPREHRVSGNPSARVCPPANDRTPLPQKLRDAFNAPQNLLPPLWTPKHYATSCAW